MSVPAASDFGDKGILRKLEPLLREGKSHTWLRSQAEEESGESGGAEGPASASY